MKWLKWIAIGGAVLLALLALLPMFFSVNDLIPRIEQAATEVLKEPVKIRSLKVALLPLPHATVDGISVGTSNDIKVEKVVVSPDLMSMFSTTRVIRSMEIRGLMVSEKAIDRIPVWAGNGGTGGEAAVRIERIDLEDATVKLPKATIGPFEARITLNRGGEPVEARLATADGKLKADVVPAKGGFTVNLVARAWTMPFGAPMMFDELSVKGVATMHNADLRQIEAKLYGGTVRGAITAEWRKGLRLKGNLDVQQVEIRPLLKSLGRPDNVSGRITAKPVFSAVAADPARLADALRLESSFSVANGVLHGMDISRAATSLISKEGSRGGETRFDTLSGHLTMDRGTRRLTRLNIVSGSLSAIGNVTISPRDDLSGRIEAKVAASKLGSAAMPLNVAGTTQSPLLYPTGGTLAGAALGTAVLGPGVGTSVGARVGAWTEGLFGKQDSAAK